MDQRKEWIQDSLADPFFDPFFPFFWLTPFSFYDPFLTPFPALRGLTPASRSSNDSTSLDFWPIAQRPEESGSKEVVKNLIPQ